MSEALLRVFIDTNVLFSAVYSRSGVPGQLLAATASMRFQPILSSRVLDEIVRNIRSKSPDRLPVLTSLLATIPFEVIPNPPEAAVEPWLEAGFSEDAVIVAAAISAGADYLCTGDNGVHAKATACEAAGLKLIRPADLLRLLTDT